MVYSARKDDAISERIVGHHLARAHRVYRYTILLLLHSPPCRVRGLPCGPRRQLLKSRMISRAALWPGAPVDAAAGMGAGRAEIEPRERQAVVGIAA